MLFVPWRYICNWKCIACGECCRSYRVVLTFPEWLRVVKNYGVEKTSSGLDKLFIRRESDGSCAFLCNLSNMYLCGLQHMKPKACKLWPFKILNQPKFGHAKEAVYDYGRYRLFIYADSNCSGLRLGRPTMDFTDQTLKEVVNIALGRRNGQLKTTAKIRFIQPYTRLRI